LDGPESPDIDDTGPLYMIAATGVRRTGSWEVTAAVAAGQPASAAGQRAAVTGAGSQQTPGNARREAGDPLHRTASAAIHFGGPEPPDIDGTGPLYMIAARVVRRTGSWEVTRTRAVAGQLGIGRSPGSRRRQPAASRRRATRAGKRVIHCTGRHRRRSTSADPNHRISTAPDRCT
jgi:hypothetical protein